MERLNPGCLGDYDFDQIIYFARKRFIEGHSTVSLIEQATSQREKEEIALVCLLDVKDEDIKDFQTSCRYSDTCKVINCRDKLKKMLELEMAATQKTGGRSDLLFPTGDDLLS